MAPSTTATSISTFLMSHGTLLVLQPLRQTNADLKSAKDVLVLACCLLLILLLLLLLLLLLFYFILFFLFSL